MSSTTLGEHYDRYAAAWNDHDPEGAMDAFAPGGTMTDPATDGVLAGEEIGEWVEETVAGFPDVSFTEDRRVEGDGVLFVEWTMRGTHDGQFGPLPPTRRSVEVSGVDVVTGGEEGITSITGYLDMSEFRAQLGLTFPEVVGQLPKLAAGAVKNGL